MYNTDTPARAELPTSRQLKRSTLIAAISAALLLVVVVMPAEYGIDPTGIGRVLRLTEMGEIKKQLAAEAAADTAAAQAGATPSAVQNASAETSIASPAPTPTIAATPAAAPTANAVAKVEWKDEIAFTLTPGEGLEVKLKMTAGAKAQYAWMVEGGAVNFDTHGDGGGRSISYEKGRGVASDEGVLEAAFTGNHGWYWRNRGKADVKVIVRTRGDYSDIKKMM